jgi:hypothetical protein
VHYFNNLLTACCFKKHRNHVNSVYYNFAAQSQHFITTAECGHVHSLTSQTKYSFRSLLCVPSGCQAVLETNLAVFPSSCPVGISLFTFKLSLFCVGSRNTLTAGEQHIPRGQTNSLLANRGGSCNYAFHMQYRF